jgi:hypothetical protein
MKKIILLNVITFLSAFAYSQQKTYPIQDTVFVEGYYIIRYKKEEIHHKQKNLKREEEGKSFEIMIDYNTYLYYFTTKIDGRNTLSDKKTIADIISTNNEYKNLEIYKFPPYSQTNIDSIFRTYKINTPENENIFNKDNEDIYFTLSDNDYLYRICYIQRHALRVPVKMDWDIILAVKWNITPTFINKNIPAFYIYYFYKYNTIIWNAPLPGFKKW